MTAQRCRSSVLRRDQTCALDKRQSRREDDLPDSQGDAGWGLGWGPFASSALHPASGIESREQLVSVECGRVLTYLLVFWSTHQSPASHHLTSRGQSGPCICRDGRLIDLRVHCARASTGGRVPPWGGVGLWWGSPLWTSPPGARRPRVSEVPSLTRCHPPCLLFFRRSLAVSILVVS